MKNHRYDSRYKVEVAGKSLPVLTNLDKGRYGVLIFENLNKYLQMDKWNRELLDKYCREYSVGIVGFAPPGEESLVGAQLKGFPLFIHTNLRLKVSRANVALLHLRSATARYVAMITSVRSIMSLRHTATVALIAR